MKTIEDFNRMLAELERDALQRASGWKTLVTDDPGTYDVVRFYIADRGSDFVQAMTVSSPVLEKVGRQSQVLTNEQFKVLSDSMFNTMVMLTEEKVGTDEYLRLSKLLGHCVVSYSTRTQIYRDNADKITHFFLIAYRKPGRLDVVWRPMVICDEKRENAEPALLSHNQIVSYVADTEAQDRIERPEWFD